MDRFCSRKVYIRAAFTISFKEGVGDAKWLFQCHSTGGGKLVIILYQSHTINLKGRIAIFVGVPILDNDQDHL